MHFRVWAPSHKTVEVVLEQQTASYPLSPEAEGYFAGIVAHAKPGDLYNFLLDGESKLADPASRFQPQGVAGPSQVVDVSAFRWTDSEWKGVSMAGQVLYEMHIGTFTQQGTLRAAAKLLPELKNLGITVIELMPLSDFVGKFGWGYDGVFLYALYEQYGMPEDLVDFVNTAHLLGLGVILDVVYNHLGPTGNVLPSYAPQYFSETEKTDWGAAINFDGPQSGPVRNYFCENAVYWIRDFHFDGLRLDATQDIHDRSKKHILVELAESARAAVGNRKLIMIAENEPQQSYYVRPLSENGYALDGLWNDDFHHSATAALTGQSDAYYSDYKGRPQEFISALKYGYLYQGQRYMWQKQNRGVPGLDISRAAFVHFLENHDQVANSATGARLSELTSPGKLKAMTAVLLLGTATPMLFQGQEYASAKPFLYFADHCETPELAKAVQAGRRDFLKQWQSMNDPALDQYLADPCSSETFEKCKLDWNEDRKRNRHWYDLHADLLRLRREDPVFSAQAAWGMDGAVLTSEAFVIRFFSPGFAADRLLLVNFGVETILSPLPEPLLAPPLEKQWAVSWSSENPRYGGHGVAPVIMEQGWRIPGYAAVVLAPQPATNSDYSKNQ